MYGILANVNIFHIEKEVMQTLINRLFNEDNLTVENAVYIHSYQMIVPVDNSFDVNRTKRRINLFDHSFIEIK